MLLQIAQQAVQVKETAAFGYLRERSFEQRVRKTFGYLRHAPSE